MKAAVVYLAQAKPKCMQKLSRSLKLLQQNLLRTYPYPVVLFHEGDFTHDIQQSLRGVCPTIEFREVDISPPPWIDCSDSANWAMRKSHGLGYNNMCRFFTIGIYEHLQDFDYYMRLDDDSYIQSPFLADPFVFMRDNGKEYGFRGKAKESRAAIQGLKKCLEDFDPRIKMLPEPTRVYYTNFHMARTQLWSSEPMRGALQCVDRNGGIYKKRWGDAPIHTLLLPAYLQPNQIHRFTDFAYQHGRYRWPAGK